jgi:SAM-dependent methyltransferase
VDRVRQNGVGAFFLQAAVGSLVVGSLLAACGAAVTWAVTARRAVSPTEGAIRRVVARYRVAPPADRFYVASKLRSDPAVEAVMALPGQFGATIDAGCGRGQLGLLLLELGRVSGLTGFDWDERKVSVARAAGRSDASFDRADLTDFEWPRADTVLLIDVLHYLPVALQDRVLERAAGALSAGGRLVIREVDARPGGRARLAMLFERIAAKIGYNRAGALQYRSAEDIVGKLSGLGLSVDVSGSAGSALANVLIVGTQPNAELRAPD